MPHYFPLSIVLCTIAHFVWSENAMIVNIIDPATPHRYAKYSSEFVEQSYLEFSIDGFTMLPNHLPDLRSAEIQISIQSALAVAKLHNLRVVDEELVRNHGLNCSEMSFTSCPSWRSVSERIHLHLEGTYLRGAAMSLTDEERSSGVQEMYDQGVQAMQCCVLETNKEMQRTGRAPITLPSLQPNKYPNAHFMDNGLMTLATAPKLGHVAGYMLNEEVIRLYDTVLHDFSPGARNEEDIRWHQDLREVPLDTKSGGFVTFWCPLSDHLSPFLFAKRSHKDIAAHFWYANKPDPKWQEEGRTWSDTVAGRYDVMTYSELGVGDCSLHHGWTLYGDVLRSRPADHEPNNSSSFAISFSYVVGDAKVLPTIEESKDVGMHDAVGIRRDPYHKWSYNVHPTSKSWLRALGAGALLHSDHPLMSVVFNATETTESEVSSRVEV